MIVNYLGERAFRLQSGDTSLLIDPDNNRLKADVILRTLAPVTTIAGSTTEISFPGEYEIKGMEIQGWARPEESSAKFLKTVFLVRWDDITFAFLGHSTEIPEPDLLGKIAEADVLFMAVDPKHYFSSEHALKLIKQCEPHLAIPAYVGAPKDLVKDLGVKGEVLDKFVFKKKDIVNDQDKIILLQAS